MPALIQYFHNAAATISYDAAGYIRLDWQSVPVSSQELRAIYEHLLRAMHHFSASSLMTIHNKRHPMPQDVQQWLVEEWIPRAIAEVNYGRCAIVEADSPLSRLAARTVGGNLPQRLVHAYFATAEEAATWMAAK